MSRTRETAAERRRTPVQGRARRTVAKICEAAAELLAESGMPGFNTNAIAARAGVNVATLYSYFPDKHAVLHELAERFETLRSGYVESRIDDLAAAPDWRPVHDAIIDQMVRFRLEEPAGLELRRALVAVPELRGLDHASTVRSGEALARAFHARRPGLAADRAALMGRVVAETATQLLDAAFRTDPYDPALITELKTIVNTYLARYLE